MDAGVPVRVGSIRYRNRGPNAAVHVGACNARLAQPVQDPVIADLDHILRELAGRGLIAATHTIEHLTGNADRAPERARLHCLVRPSEGASLKLTIGRDLAAPRARSLAFAKVFPQLSPAEAFFTRIADVDVWATTAVSATPLDDLDKSANSAARLLSALHQIEATLDSNVEAATPLDFTRAWTPFADSTLALNCWNGPERLFLRDTALPCLATALQPLGASQRWTNGDFISSNVCVTDDGRPVVFDAEYAAKTVFHAEDHVRFRRISPLCRRHPGLLAGWWPTPDPAWEIFFQLRQLGLESVENSSAYVGRVAPERKSAVRYLGEATIGPFPPTWPEPIAPPPFFHGEVAQLFWRNEHEVISEARSLKVEFPVGGRQLIGFRLPARAFAWRLDPVASRRRVLVHAVVAVLAAPSAGSPAIGFQVEGAHVEVTPCGHQLSPHGSDPQLHFVLPPPAIGLVAELSCN